jgi:DNA-directed RNA polymerase specialized sigma24 family protein
MVSLGAVGGAERLSEAQDLRRRVARDQRDRLVELAAGLPEPDRVLVELVIREGRPISQIARLQGVEPLRLRRRLKRLLRRLASDEYLFVSRHVLVTALRGEPVSHWPATRRRVAQACFMHGLSLRQAATALHLSLHAVRGHRDAVRALVQSIRG